MTKLLAVTDFTIIFNTTGFFNAELVSELKRLGYKYSTEHWFNNFFEGHYWEFETSDDAKRTEAIALAYKFGIPASDAAPGFGTWGRVETLASAANLTR